MPEVSAKSDFLQAKDRVEAWWAGSSLGRPAVICRIAKGDAPPRPTDERSRAQRDLDPEWHLAQAQWLLDAHEFPAETMPGIYPVHADSLAIPAVFAGAELEYHPDTTWIKPIADIYRRDLGEFSTDDPVFVILDRVLRLMGERLGRRGLLSGLPLMDGVTTLSLFRTPQALCVDVVDRPEDVKRVSRKLNEIAIAAYEAFFATLTALGHPQTITWCDIYAPGKCEMVQCDFALMLSPEMFERFVMPELRLLTGYMDYSCYHLDGTGQTRFLDQLCTLEAIAAIQWNPEPPAPPPLEWLDFYREVRRRGRSLWIACDAETAVGLTRELGPDGLMLSVRGIDTLEQFGKFLKRLTKASG